LTIYTFPKKLDSAIEPYIMFQSFEWTTIGKKTQEVEVNRNPIDTIALPMSSNGIISSISNKWEESDIKKTENLTESLKAYGASKAKDLGGIAINRYFYDEGIAINDFMGLVYDGVNLRQFSFTYELIPESAEESEIIKEIIKSFKRNSIGTYTKEWQVFYPKFWTIRVIFPQDKSNIQIKDCVCTSITDAYFTDSKMPFNDGSPPKVDFDITFKELDKLSGEDYE